MLTFDASTRYHKKTGNDGLFSFFKKTEYAKSNMVNVRFLSLPESILPLSESHFSDKEPSKFR